MKHEVGSDGVAHEQDDDKLFLFVYCLFVFLFGLVCLVVVVVFVIVPHVKHKKIGFRKSVAELTVLSRILLKLPPTPPSLQS